MLLYNDYIIINIIKNIIFILDIQILHKKEIEVVSKLSTFLNKEELNKLFGNKSYILAKDYFFIAFL